MYLHLHVCCDLLALYGVSLYVCVYVTLPACLLSYHHACLAAADCRCVVCRTCRLTPEAEVHCPLHPPECCYSQSLPRKWHCKPWNLLLQHAFLYTPEENHRETLRVNVLFDALEMLGFQPDTNMHVQDVPLIFLDWHISQRQGWREENWFYPAEELPVQAVSRRKCPSLGAFCQALTGSENEVWAQSLPPLCPTQCSQSAKQLAPSAPEELQSVLLDVFPLENNNKYKITFTYYWSFNLTVTFTQAHIRALTK